MIASRASVLQPEQRKKVEISDDALTVDSSSIVDDPEIDLICELIGGVEEARRLTLQAFANGKSVILTNKDFDLQCSDELFNAAEKLVTICL